MANGNKEDLRRARVLQARKLLEKSQQEQPSLTEELTQAGGEAASALREGDVGGAMGALGEARETTQEAAGGFLSDLGEAANRRGVFSATGATIGTAAGSPLGPPGMVSGGILGAGIGSALFDVSEVAQGEDVSLPEQVRNVSNEMMLEGTFGTLTGPTFRLAGSIGKRILGLGSDQAAEIAQASARSQVPLGSFHATGGTPGKVIEAGRKVAGVFPIAGGPFRKAQRRATEEFVNQTQKLTKRLGPVYTLGELGVGATEDARKLYARRSQLHEELYENFFEKAKNVSVKKVFPGSVVGKEARLMLEDLVNNQATTAAGKPVGTRAPKVPPRVKKHLEEIRTLAEFQSVEQLRDLKQRTSSLFESTKNKTARKYLTRVNMAIESAMNNPETSMLPKEEADTLVDSLRKANEAFVATRNMIDSPTAKKFQRVDENIFRPGAEKPRNLNPDQILPVVFDRKSVEGIKQFRGMVSDETYSGAVRRFLDDSIQDSFRAVGREGKTSTIVDAKSFKENLGLNTPDGRAMLKETVRGTNVTFQQLKDLGKVAEALDGVEIPNPSTFLQRGMVLRAGGGAGLGAASFFSPKVIAAIAITNRASKFISNPDLLQTLTGVVKEGTGDRQRRLLAVRLARQAFEDQPDLVGSIEDALLQENEQEEQ